MPNSNDDGPESYSVVTPAVVPARMPQFATAEYAHLPATETCTMCGRLLSESYYRVQEKKICSACAERVQETFPRDNHGAFSRALLLGVGAAVVGLAVYAGFTIVTHIYLGYLALGVGWLVAKSMMKGSGGVGGRRYQVAAVLLTYAAISLAEVPILIYHLLQTSDLQVLRRTKQGVALDLAQICSATRLPPSRALESIRHLAELGLVRSESDSADRTMVRYRKQVADDLIGGGE